MCQKGYVCTCIMCTKFLTRKLTKSYEFESHWWLGILLFPLVYLPHYFPWSLLSSTPVNEEVFHCILRRGLVKPGDLARLDSGYSRPLFPTTLVVNPKGQLKKQVENFMKILCHENLELYGIYSQINHKQAIYSK